MPDTPPTAETAQRLTGALGAKYQVRALLGRGGFAEVYEVFDLELERRLAVKVLRPDIAWTSGMLQRFRHETRAIARLQHPHILPIHFVGEGEGLVYYAMPYVEGRSLGDLLRGSGALAPERALGIAVPVLQALEHAHAQGLIHRDIKPDNILLDAASGRPLLVDFGIAKRLDAEAGLTQTGFVVGTPHYMSPEQALGQGDLDARSDLYAFGAVLFQMVTGAPPFDGESSQEIVGKHLAEPPPIPAEVNARIPPWLSRVITRCLAKKPNDRYQSAAMVLDALAVGRASGPSPAPSEDLVIAGVSTEARTEIVPSGERRSAGAPVAAPRRRARWWVALALGAVAIAVVAWWVTRPVLAFENRLVTPVRLTSAGRERVLPPGARLAVRLPRRRPFVATWTLVRPPGTDGELRGAELSGTINLARPRGRIERAARASRGDEAYFAPLITNATGVALRVVVNDGLQGAVDCGCTVPPGATREFIGYYQLFRNSTVTVIDPQGRSARFRDLGPDTDRESGAVGLRFAATDLR